jgi:hypothetical protein
VELAGSSNANLERIFLRGDTPSAESLAGFEYQGANVSPIMRLLGNQKFIKGFFLTEDGRRLGYNSPVRQTGLSDPWVARPDLARPKRFGFYLVRPVDPEARDNRYLHALLLDYSAGDAGDVVTAAIRDYLVRVETGSDELLLGKAYVALGPLSVFSNFFVLERLRPSSAEE